ncbi:hypothetical protein HPB50_017285 [Hyalomma asiaticum]|uniref:Uncharacterized protein n=1 Tax=Hyalomma asiaticum TaxID=266040 RepID=A0ACB7TM43_HYAAI|nr:hypothetical protein HPB50_017285 [Hyalomma asiaticum]
MQQQQPLKVKANTISKYFKRAGSRLNAEVLEDNEQSDTVANEVLNTADMQSGLNKSTFAAATGTFQEYVNAGESELPVHEKAITDDMIVTAVRGSAEVATDDGSDSEYDADPTPEADFLCKDALGYLMKVKAYCVKKSLSKKSPLCLSFVEDEIVWSAIHKHCRTKITALLR